MGDLGMLFFLVILLYFLPSFVAHFRRHRNENPIFLINLFLGWTFLGWVGALAWSASDNCRPKPANSAADLAIQQERMENAENIFSWIFGVLSFLLRTIGILVGLALIGYGIRELSAAYQHVELWNDYQVLVKGLCVFVGFLLAWFGILPLLKYEVIGGFISASFRIMGIFYGVALGYVAGSVIVTSWKELIAANHIIETLAVAYIPVGILFLSLFFVWFGLRPSAHHA